MVTATPLDIVALGEAMIEFNQTNADACAYVQGFGGDTSNALIAAARQGAKGGYITKLGDDTFGRMLLQLWHDENVDTEGVAIDAAAPTGIYFVSHGTHGHMFFSHLRAGSAASCIRPSDVPAALVERARILHVSGISQAISASAADSVFHAINIACAAGVKVAYDPNLRLKLWPLERARAVILATIPLTDYFLPSLDDVRLLSGLDDPVAILEWCHGQGARTVVFKLGKAGSWVSHGAERTRVPAFPVNAIDATGAGDCFDGSLLARLAAGDDVVSAARWASAAAALTTIGYGAVAPLPTADRVAQFLASGATNASGSKQSA
jgi:2-dehydro-3-deoxygluconokinase